jgi:tetratricopeptide (TPR) repeat protein
VLFLLLSRSGVAGGENLFAATARGVKGYLELYSDSGSSRYTFDFFSAAHALAVLNDLMLLAPIALVAVAVGVRKSLPFDPVGVLLAIAAFFCVLASMLFNREIGAYRDWDALAPYAFVTSAWAGRCLARSHRNGIAIVWMLAIAALLHVLPWVLMNANSGSTERHIRIALTEPNMWSPYARGYMHEEFAILARDEGDLASAFREYNAAARASPRDPRYRLGVADMAFALGDPETAARHYEETLMLRPDFLAAHNNLAFLLLTAGDLARARFHAREAIRINPDSSEPYLILGDVEMQSGDVKAAVAAWNRAVELRPDSPARSRLESLRCPGDVK